MAEFIVSKSTRFCATCRNWTGERQPNDPMAYNIKCPSNLSKGRCYGKFNGMVEIEAMGSCEKWEQHFR